MDVVVRAFVAFLFVYTLTRLIGRRELSSMQPFDLVFLDPPYGKGLGLDALQSAASGGWIRDGAIAVLEERADAEVEPPASFEELDARVYGVTKIVVMQAFPALGSAARGGRKPADVLE